MGIRIPRYSVFRGLEAQQREFAIKTINELMNNGQERFLYYQPCLNIMKLIEMYWAHLEPGFNDDRDHWLDMVMRSIEDSNRFIIPQTFFVWLEDSSSIISKVLGVNEARDFMSDFQNPLEYLNFIRKHLLNDIKNNEVKYSRWFSKNPIIRTEEDYLFYYKYIALCVSKQIDPDTYYDIYDSELIRKVNVTKINYSRDMFPDKNLLKKVIYKCIKNIVNDIY